MASSDYCRCAVCGFKSFYDATLYFRWVTVDGRKDPIPAGAGEYAGLCVECAKTHTLIAVGRVEPVTIEVGDYL